MQRGEDMLLKNEADRLLIFFFYDRDGIVDEYVTYMLSDMKKNVKKIIFVSNGKIEPASKEKISFLADEIIERENKGLDVWAYRSALESEGWETLKKYDEVIMMNTTIMGPVYPFKEMFDYMDSRDVDLWGITKFHKVNFDPFGIIKCGYIPEHIQSHFITVRKSIICSEEFEKYWENIPEIKSYKESVAYHETQFTRHFEKLGYKWETYVNTDDLEGFTYAPILYCAKKLIEEKRCPVFKRRSFMHDYTDVINSSIGETAYELLEYIKEKTSYDVNMIWDNILRCYNMSEIKDCLHLNYVLPEIATTRTEKEKAYTKKKIALVFHSYFSDLNESTFHYVDSMPKESDIYITTDTVEKKCLLEEMFSNHNFNKLEVILIENRGRDVSALLVATKQFILDYDYVCFAHDKKVSQLKLGSAGASFAYLCLENTLGTAGYVQNIIDLFEHNPRLGIIMPPPPYHGEYFMTLSGGWGPNFNITKSLYDKLKLNVPMTKDTKAVAPLGTMFWFRPQGMKKLFDCDWEYSDFPEEPNKVDGTLLHAVERIYAYVEQDAGYYAAWCFSDKLASLQITNYNYMLSGIVKELEANDAKSSYDVAINNIGGSLAVVEGLKKMGFAAPIRNTSGEFMKLYYDCGRGLNEKDSLILSADNEEEFILKYKIPDCDSVKTFRFDPGEIGCIWLTDLKIEIKYNDGKNKKIKVISEMTNGISQGDKLVFLGQDPYVLWMPEKKDGINQVIISGKIHRNLSAYEIKSMISPKSFVKRAFGYAKRLLKKTGEKNG